MKKRIVVCCLMLLSLMATSAQETTESDTMHSQQHFYTYHNATGNRLITGTGTFPDVRSVDIALDNVPVWLIAANHPDLPPITMVQTADDRLQTIDLRTGEITQREGVYPATQPIALHATDDAWQIITTNSNALTNPTVLSSGAVLSLTGDGQLRLSSTQGTLLDLNSQPDAKIALSDDGRLALYANATNQRYVHGIMGDDLEGASLVVLTITDEGQLDIIEQIDLEGDAIYEGLSPMWADVNADGTQDLITTVSDSRVGSRIRVYLFTENGTLTVEGQAIGRSGRWQHQLAWGAFGADGQMQLVEVLTPHIGGVVRFYEFDGENLTIVSQLAGYTSHVIGSRNLDLAVAGDFDGDGQPEIVLPSQDRRRIAGIANTASGARVVWELALDSTLVTNLAAANTDNGLMLAAGRADGTVRLWLPQN